MANPKVLGRGGSTVSTCWNHRHHLSTERPSRLWAATQSRLRVIINLDYLTYHKQYTSMSHFQTLRLMTWTTRLRKAWSGICRGRCLPQPPPRFSQRPTLTYSPSTRSSSSRRCMSCRISQPSTHRLSTPLPLRYRRCRQPSASSESTWRQKTLKSWNSTSKSLSSLPSMSGEKGLLISTSRWERAKRRA